MRRTIASVVMILPLILCTGALCAEPESLANIKKLLKERVPFEESVDACLAELKNAGYVLKDYDLFMTVHKLEPCKKCSGSGMVITVTPEKRTTKRCTSCDGDGKLTVAGINNLSATARCSTCKGTGRVEVVLQKEKKGRYECSACSGTGGRTGASLGNAGDLRHTIEPLDQYMIAAKKLAEFDEASRGLIDEILGDETVRTLPPEMFKTLMQMRAGTKNVQRALSTKNSWEISGNDKIALAYCQVVGLVREKEKTTFVLRQFDFKATFKVVVPIDNGAVKNGNYVIVRGFVAHRLDDKAFELTDFVTYPSVVASDEGEEIAKAPVEPAKPDPSKEAKGKLSLARNYRAAGMTDPAIKALDEIIQKFPNTPQAAQAKELKQSIEQEASK